MRVAKLPPTMAVSKMLPDRHYIITAVNSCKSYQRFLEKLLPPQNTSPVSAAKRDPSVAELKFSIDSLVHEDITQILVLCRAITHPAESINFTFQGNSTVPASTTSDPDTQGQSEARPPQENIQNLLCIHVVERVNGDFIPNNLIYDLLKCYQVGPDGSSKIDGFAELLRQTRSQPAHSAADAQAALGLSPDSPRARTPEAKFDSDPLAREANARLKSESNVQISVSSPGPSSVFTFYPFPVLVGVSIPYRSEHFCVMVNLRPILPHHLMVVPLRCVGTIHGLTEEELKDWGHTMALTLRVLNEVHNRTCQDHAPLRGSTGVSYSVAIQQGRDSGQTVPHLHTHIIPFNSPEDLSVAPDTAEGEVPKPSRTSAEMAEETAFLKPIFNELRKTIK